MIAVTKNRVELVQKALPMWHSLKGRNDEFIVVDGDSDDGTYELLKREEGKLIDLLIHEPDESEADALNKGFLKAKGIIIKIITDDDIFYPDALEKAYSVMLENPEIDILITGGERVKINKDGTIGKTINYQWFNEKSDINTIENIIGLCGIGMLIRKSSLSETGLINPNHLLADTSYLIQSHLIGSNIHFIRIKGFLHLYYSWSFFSQKGKIKEEYIKIMKDFNLQPKGKFIRAIQNPGKVWNKVVFHLTRRITDNEPDWDGKLI